MQRGIRRKEIFSAQNDYHMFLTILSKELKRNQCKLHAYCLMTNHYHLLVETSEYEVWKFMKNLAHNYAQYYNSVNAFQGHLFEGRYKSCLVQDDAYFLQTSRYIHLNPVKARMAAHPEDYKWSSYRTMLGISDDQITVKERTLGYLKGKSVHRYRDFVEDIGHKYMVTESEIHKEIEEDEIWLPW